MELLAQEAFSNFIHNGSPPPPIHSPIREEFDRLVWEAGEASADPDVMDSLDERMVIEEFVRMATQTRAELEKAQAAFDEFRAQSGLTTWSALSEAPDAQPDWLVDKMLPVGGVGMIVAKPKVGKSTALRCLIHAVLTGGQWLGRSSAIAPVVYATWEDRRAVVKDHLQMLGLNGKADLSLFFGDRDIGDPAAWLSGAIMSTGAKLAVIDPFFRFMQVEDGNDYAELTKATGRVMEVARNTGCAVVLAHHARKSEGEYGDEALGSTAMFGAVDCMVSLRRDGDKRMVMSTQREGVDLPKTEIVLNDGGQVVLGDDWDEQRREAYADEVLNFMRANADEGPFTVNVLAEKIALGKRNLRASLRYLVDNDLVDRTGTGKRGDPFCYVSMSL